jgi:hypothetical protein
VEGLVWVDCGGTRGHADGGMNQMPIMFSLQKAPEKLLFGERREGSRVRLNDKVSELDEVSNYVNGGYHQDRREPNRCSACRTPQT